MNENELMEVLRKEFKFLELKRFEIVSNYVTGMVRVSDIEDFKEKLFGFRDKLYAISISDDNLIEIAKMKSVVQHLNTEVLEDEDILAIAYQNENSGI